ncbi:hypothetical protein TNIN_172531 [Trichonephila inaurata madagascariensis]|uniref:Uncharacterized protein n=1 Tax=Trichonephila inaurata madagascariensis TaxID=2747483 RepID=A0A8X6Y4I4_9ARAC|nr:hypothetical protein TNIN_172531 [Trichonephila inaurata madagascariensis]
MASKQFENSMKDKSYELMDVLLKEIEPFTSYGGKIGVLNTTGVIDDHGLEKFLYTSPTLHLGSMEILSHRNDGCKKP